MTTYIYLHQESPKLRDEEKEIAQYMKNCNLKADQTISDDQPGKLHWTSRAMHVLMKKAHQHDTIVVYEASHIACSTSQMLEILGMAVSRKINIHFAKYNARIMSSEEQVDTQHLLNTISKIESDFVSKRTSQALARRKAAGLPLGRPKGRGNKSLKLDKYREEIGKYMTLGISKASIAKLVDCHPQTLYDWLDRTETRNDSAEEVLH